MLGDGIRCAVRLRGGGMVSGLLPFLFSRALRGLLRRPGRINVRHMKCAEGGQQGPPCLCRAWASLQIPRKKQREGREPPCIPMPGVGMGL